MRTQGACLSGDRKLLPEHKCIGHVQRRRSHFTLVSGSAKEDRRSVRAHTANKCHRFKRRNPATSVWESNKNERSNKINCLILLSIKILH